MYLGAWDEIHYADLLSMINQLTIDGATSLRLMADEGSIMAQKLTGTDAEVYKLSTSFITGEPYQHPDFTLMDPEGAHIIRQGLLASKYIDDLPESFKDN